MKTIEEYKKDLEPKKEYPIEGKPLWFIRDFLSKEEIEWIMNEANKPEAWYVTMRSPWPGAIRNKFLMNVPEYLEDGTLKLPGPDSPQISVPLFENINAKCIAVLPANFVGCAALQSVFSAPEEVVRSANPGPIERNFSMDWHYENAPGKNIGESDENHPKITASFSIYINDNFEGGELMFKNFPDVVIKPEPGMLINIPLTEEFEHKVAYVSSGVRHSLYGLCWTENKNLRFSTNEDC